MPHDRHSLDQFYDELAPVYHLKVDWANRHGKERPLFDLLTADPKPQSVLDLGCGDGGHASIFTDQGIRYVGVDNSRAMIAMAKRGVASKLARFQVGDLRRLPTRWRSSFDLCLLLGNTLPHLQTKQELRLLFRTVARILTGQSRFVIQTVNPAVLAAKTVHFLAPKFAGGRTLFAPFYVNRGDHWDFHMMIHAINDGRLESSTTITTRLRFWSKAEIVACARESGFGVKAVYGGAALPQYEPRRSENLIVVLLRK